MKILALLFTFLFLNSAWAVPLPQPRPDQELRFDNNDIYKPGVYTPRFEMAQATAPATTATTTETTTPVPPTSVTTTVKGGNLAAQILEWIQVALIPTIGGVFLWLLIKGLGYIGVVITDAQKAQLQGIVVNGLNSAASKAEVDLRATDKLDVHLKNQIVADAVDYAQRHGAETIKALGLDPNSGEAVEAIKARIATALNDPTEPTPPAITPPEVLAKVPAVNGVPLQGRRV